MKKCYLVLLTMMSVLFFRCDREEVTTKVPTTQTQPELSDRVRSVGSNPYFIRYVRAAKELALILYYNHSKANQETDKAHPFSKFEASQSRVSKLLQNELSKQELPLLLREYGSKEQEVTQLVGRMSLNILLLNHIYGEPILERLSRAEYNQAYDFAHTQVANARLGLEGNDVPGNGVIMVRPIFRTTC